MSWIWANWGSAGSNPRGRGGRLSPCSPAEALRLWISEPGPVEPPAGARGRLGLFDEASVAIDGSKFKAVNNRDRNFKAAQMKRRMEQSEQRVARYLHQRGHSDRQGPYLAQPQRTKHKKATITETKKKKGAQE